jgi:hypothetical protein
MVEAHRRSVLLCRAAARASWRLLSLGLLLLMLSGCMLISGETTAVDIQDGAGNLLTSFVGAEGSGERLFELGMPDAEVRVIVILGVESGDLELSLIEPDGSVAFVVTARPDAEVTRSGAVRTDALGRLRYQLSARGARSGAIQIFVQP